MAYKHRKEIGTPTEQLFEEEILKPRNLNYELTGGETRCNLTTNQLCEVEQKLLEGIKVDNPQRLLRYYSDFTIKLGDNSKEFFFAEIKNSEFIEKDAYEAYVDLAKNGYKIALFKKENSKWYYVNPLNIILQRVDSFNHDNLPTDGDFWVTPRNLPKTEYDNWKLNHPKASGTPFGCYSHKTQWKEWPMKINLN